MDNNVHPELSHIDNVNKTESSENIANFEYTNTIEFVINILELPGKNTSADFIKNTIERLDNLGFEYKIEQNTNTYYNSLQTGGGSTFPYNMFETVVNKIKSTSKQPEVDTGVRTSIYDKLFSYFKKEPTIDEITSVDHVSNLENNESKMETEEYEIPNEAPLKTYPHKQMHIHIIIKIKDNMDEMTGGIVELNRWLDRMEHSN